MQATLEDLADTRDKERDARKRCGRPLSPLLRPWPRLQKGCDATALPHTSIGRHLTVPPARDGARREMKALAKDVKAISRRIDSSAKADPAVRYPGWRRPLQQVWHRSNRGVARQEALALARPFSVRFGPLCAGRHKGSQSGEGIGEGPRAPIGHGGAACKVCQTQAAQGEPNARRIQ